MANSGSARSGTVTLTNPHRSITLSISQQAGSVPDEIVSTQNSFEIVDTPVIIASNTSTLTVKVRSCKIDTYKSGTVKTVPVSFTCSSVYNESSNFDSNMVSGTSAVSIPSTASFSSEGVATINISLSSKNSNAYGRRVTLRFNNATFNENLSHTVTQTNTTSTTDYIFLDPIDAPSDGWVTRSNYAFFVVFAARGGSAVPIEYYIDDLAYENLYNVNADLDITDGYEYYGLGASELDGSISIRQLPIPKTGALLGKLVIRQKVGASSTKLSSVSVEIRETDRYQFGNPLDSNITGGLSSGTAHIWGGSRSASLGYIDSGSVSLNEDTWAVGSISPITPTVQSKPSWLTVTLSAESGYPESFNINVSVSSFNDGQSGDIILKQSGSNKTFTINVTWHLGNDTSGGGSGSINDGPKYTFTWGDGSTSTKTISLPGWNSAQTRTWGTNVMNSNTAIKQISTSKTQNGSTQYIDIKYGQSSLYGNSKIEYYQSDDVDYSGSNHSGNNALMILDIRPNDDISERTVSGVITQPESGKALNIKFVQEPRYSLTFETSDGKYDVEYDIGAFYSSSQSLSVKLSVSKRYAADTSSVSPSINVRCYRSGNDVTDSEVEISTARHSLNGGGYNIFIKGKNTGIIPATTRVYQLKVTETSFNTQLTINITCKGKLGVL